MEQTIRTCNECSASTLVYYRLWYTYKGTPLDREGGIWWYEEATSEQELRAEELKVRRPFIVAFAIEDDSTERFRADHPRKSTEIVWQGTND